MIDDYCFNTIKWLFVITHCTYIPCMQALPLQHNTRSPDQIGLKFGGFRWEFENSGAQTNHLWTSNPAPGATICLRSLIKPLYCVCVRMHSCVCAHVYVCEHAYVASLGSNTSHFAAITFWSIKTKCIKICICVKNNTYKCFQRFVWKTVHWFLGLQIVNDLLYYYLNL